MYTIINTHYNSQLSLPQTSIFLLTADALHYSLCMTPELSPSEAKSRKKIISNSFSHHMETLMEQIKPDEVADRLYGIGVLDIDELGRASDKQEAVDDRARELVRLLKRKLWQSPEWFVDVCKILRNCGVKVIAQVIGREPMYHLTLGHVCSYYITAVIYMDYA